MITLFFAGILGIVLNIISRATIKARRKHKVLIGYGQNQDAVTSHVSAHANFCAYTPFFLILLFILENTQRVPLIFLCIVAIAFVIGRILHFISLTQRELREKPNYKFRVAGMVLTLISITILSICALITSLSHIISYL